MKILGSFWSLFALLVYPAKICLYVLVIYALILAIKALRIYINKNS